MEKLRKRHRNEHDEKDIGGGITSTKYIHNHAPFDTQRRKVIAGISSFFAQSFERHFSPDELLHSHHVFKVVAKILNFVLKLLIL